MDTSDASTDTAATDLAFAGISKQARLLRADELSSRELTQLYLDRIEAIDPTLNSFRVVHAERALAAADAADQRRANGEDAPLLGIPVAVKDELDEAGEVSHHGSAAFTRPASEDSEVVRKLKQAGAFIIGRTNLPELAIFGYTETRAFGITRNPWDTTRTPGGSSGGSGAAVAAGLIGAASASDGAGSIRIPAANNGLFGLKPQRGRVSLAPHPHHWHGMSVQGCLSRTVADTALWLDTTHGNVAVDAHRAEPMTTSFTQAAATPPGSLRIAWTTKPPRAILPASPDAEITDVTQQTATLLAELGHDVREQTPDWGMVGNGFTPLYLNGIAEDAASTDDPERLEELTQKIARLGRLMPKPLVSRALSDMASHGERINAIFEEVDVVMTPTTAQQPIEVGRWTDRKLALPMLTQMSLVYPYTVVWNYLGNPAASIPAGVSKDGLPLGVTLVAPPHREDVLLSLASQLEEALRWHEHRPSLPL